MKKKLLLIVMTLILLFVGLPIGNLQGVAICQENVQAKTKKLTDEMKVAYKKYLMKIKKENEDVVLSFALVDVDGDSRLDLVLEGKAYGATYENTDNKYDQGLGGDLGVVSYVNGKVKIVWGPPMPSMAMWQEINVDKHLLIHVDKPTWGASMAVYRMESGKGKEVASINYEGSDLEQT